MQWAAFVAARSEKIIEITIEHPKLNERNDRSRKMNTLSDRYGEWFPPYVAAISCIIANLIALSVHIFLYPDDKIRIAWIAWSCVSSLVAGWWMSVRIIKPVIAPTYLVIGFLIAILSGILGTVMVVSTGVMPYNTMLGAEAWKAGGAAWRGLAFIALVTLLFAIGGFFGAGGVVNSSHGKLRSTKSKEISRAKFKLTDKLFARGVAAATFAFFVLATLFGGLDCLRAKCAVVVLALGVAYSFILMAGEATVRGQLPVPDLISIVASSVPNSAPDARSSQASAAKGRFLTVTFVGGPAVFFLVLYVVGRYFAC